MGENWRDKSKSVKQSEDFNSILESLLLALAGTSWTIENDSVAKERKKTRANKGQKKPGL